MESFISEQQVLFMIDILSGIQILWFNAQRRD